MTSPRFRFFVSGEKKPISPETDLWHLPLSGVNPREKEDAFPLSEDAVSIGDYLTAGSRFLIRQDAFVIQKGLERILGKSVHPYQIDGIDFYLEKHGAFYHPIRIRVCLETGESVSFVLNGAVSVPGLSLIETEYKTIQGLNRKKSARFLPLVFGSGMVRTDRGRMGFFLGEWLDGYKEFHITDDGGAPKIVVWESDGTCRKLSLESSLPVYAEVARILTHYYDLETFDQVLNWHHAAGDFIVRMEAGETPEVKLITVRGYAPLTELGTDGAENKKEFILPALLFFFLDLSLRIRLDRLDGTGQFAMLGDAVVPHAIKGFLAGLKEKSGQYDYGDLKSVFVVFIRRFGPEQLSDLIEKLVSEGPYSGAETELIGQNLATHTAILSAFFKTV